MAEEAGSGVGTGGERWAGGDDGERGSGFWLQQRAQDVEAQRLGKIR